MSPRLLDALLRARLKAEDGRGDGEVVAEEDFLVAGLPPTSDRVIIFTPHAGFRLSHVSRPSALASSLLSAVSLISPDAHR